MLFHAEASRLAVACGLARAIGRDTAIVALPAVGVVIVYARGTGARAAASSSDRCGSALSGPTRRELSSKAAARAAAP